MPCPFFQPTLPFEDGAWLTPPRLPLGEPCRGLCTADPTASVEPGPDELRRCNAGYARNSCSRFPGTSGAADAVRFSITADRDGSISFLYIFEKDYGPLRHGPLAWNTVTGGLSGSLDSPTLEAQARRFIESYLKRRVNS